jgi:NDP-sugar pyrophosphorylase family protein
MHNSVIIGPCYIGKGTIIKAGAKIYENCSFGPQCKIGGEIEASTFHGYSNKQHDGFIGHSYISE